MFHLLNIKRGQTSFAIKAHSFRVTPYPVNEFDKSSIPNCWPVLGCLYFVLDSFKITKPPFKPNKA